MEVDEAELIECINLDRSGEGESLNNTTTKKTSPCSQRDQLQVMSTTEKTGPISKSFYVVQENGKQTATVTPTSVVKTMQLSALKDYLHCYRCYATFYKIQDLIQHFLDCTSERHEDLTFDQFKDQEKSRNRQHHDNNNSYSSSNSNRNKRINRSASPSPEVQYKYSDKVQKSIPRSRNNHNSTPQKQYHHHHQRQTQSSKLIKSRHSSSPSPPPIKSIISVSKPPLIKMNENDARLLLEARMRGEERRKIQRQALKTPTPKTRTRTKGEYIKGEKKKSAKETLPWRCTKCPLKYSTSRELTQHMNAHDGILPYKCTVSGCDKAFAWKKSCNRHISEHSKNPDFKPGAPRGPRVKKKEKESQDDDQIESGGES